VRGDDQKMKRFMAKFNEDYEDSSKNEKQFREEMEKLLNSRGRDDLTIVRASKYTESSLEYEEVKEERLKGKATDYLIICEGMVIAAVEVTTGVEGWSFERSSKLYIHEDKLKRMDCYNEGYVVEKVMKGEPHFIWASRKKIREDESKLHCDEEGRKFWITNPKIWKENLDGLADKLIELSR
jgi:hypothetical protein